MKIMQGPWFLIFFVLGLPVLVPTEAEVYVAALSTAWQCVLVLFYLVFDTVYLNSHLVPVCLFIWWPF